MRGPDSAANPLPILRVRWILSVLSFPICEMGITSSTSICSVIYRMPSELKSEMFSWWLPGIGVMSQDAGWELLEL
jgi:hypothetical protein